MTNRRGDADWVADKKRRAETIRAAKAALEAEAKAAAEAKVKEEAAAEEKRQAEGRRSRVRKPLPPPASPIPSPEKLHRSESRIMKSKDGFVQAYNAQAAVDAEAQSSSPGVTRRPTTSASWSRSDAIEPSGRSPSSVGHRLLLGRQHRGSGNVRIDGPRRRPGRCSQPAEAMAAPPPTLTRRPRQSRQRSNACEACARTGWRSRQPLPAAQQCPTGAAIKEARGPPPVTGPREVQADGGLHSPHC